MTSISPSDDELAAVLRALRAQYPSRGAAKLLPLLLEVQPTWTVSEKRLRKILQREGLTAAGGGTTSQATVLAEGNVPFPTSRQVAGLDTSKWTAKVRVHDFGPKKGKGLVATQAIKEGEHVWNKDPLLVAPEPFVQFFWSYKMRIVVESPHAAFTFGRILHTQRARRLPAWRTSVPTLR